MQTIALTALIMQKKYGDETAKSCSHYSHKTFKFLLESSIFLPCSKS
jgi:hypothetical protein